MTKITKTIVDKSSPKNNDYFIWDSFLPGFGIRILPSGRKTYLVQYRKNGRTRRYKIGRHGVFTPDQARQRAKVVLGNVADGKDPAAEKAKSQKDITVAALCALYLAEGTTKKRASTIYTDRGRIERHIKPLLGAKLVRSVDKEDIEKFLNDIALGKTKNDIRTKNRGRAIIKGGQGTANRTTGLLGSIFSFAIKKGFRNGNPVHGVGRFPEKSIERFLTVEEMARLGHALNEAEKNGANLYAIALIRLLAMTGCRKGELQTLKWDFVDTNNGFLNLPLSKTGQKSIPLGGPAIKLLNSLPKVQGNPYVFPGAGKSFFQGVQKIWTEVREAAALNGLRLHDLRHNFASVGASNGTSLYVLGKILGHKDQKTTQRYAHLADSPVKTTANQISEIIASAIGVYEIDSEDGQGA